MRTASIPAQPLVLTEFYQTTDLSCPCRSEKSLSPASSGLEPKSPCDRVAHICVRRPISGPRTATGRAPSSYNASTSGAMVSPREGCSCISPRSGRSRRLAGTARLRPERPWVVNLNAIQRGDVPCWESLRAAKRERARRARGKDLAGPRVGLAPSSPERTLTRAATHRATTPCPTKEPFLAPRGSAATIPGLGGRLRVASGSDREHPGHETGAIWEMLDQDLAARSGT
jgi:hypothetical protein